MANEITRLMPFRQYDENDVINFYSLDTITGAAGSVVKVSVANLDESPVNYKTRTDSSSWDATMGNALSLYPEVPYKLTKVSTTGDRPLGILLRDVRDKDENGENMLYYPEKKAELQCVSSGEAVPVATRGVFTINAKGLAGGLAPAIGSYATPSVDATLTGITPAANKHHLHQVHSIGKFIGTGLRESQSSTDAFAGVYAILKLEL